MKEKEHYTVYGNDHLEPGKELKISHSIYLGKPDISGLTVHSPDELAAMRETSIGKEQAVFEKLCAAVDEWAEVAAETKLLDKAIEFVKIPAVEHTSNQWQTDEYGNERISNMVYSMYHNVWEDTKYNRETGKSEPVAWYLTWGLSTNPPPAAQHYSRGIKIAGQDRKRFTGKVVMEKYLQGRIKAHAQYFTEICPPIPKEYANNFKVNGQLLPGYTVEGEPVKEQAPPAKDAPTPEKNAGRSSLRENLKRKGEQAKAQATPDTHPKPRTPER